MLTFIKNIKLAVWRRITQTFFGVFLTNGYIQVFTTKMLYDGPLKGICIPFLNCHSCPMAVFSCPIGMLQHYMAIQQFPLFLLGFFITVGLIFGRAACGWLCPFGLIQDIIYKIKSPKYGIPKILNYAKYPILLITVIILPYLTHVHWFSKLCPYGALIAGIPWVMWNPIDPDFETPVVDMDTVGFWFILKIIILAAFLIWFVVAKRPFCRTVCPMGAIWAIFNKISLIQIKVKESCPSCGNCERYCPMDLQVETEVDSENCIKCYECVSCKYVEGQSGFTHLVEDVQFKKDVNLVKNTKSSQL